MKPFTPHAPLPRRLPCQHTSALHDCTFTSVNAVAQRSCHFFELVSPCTTGAACRSRRVKHRTPQLSSVITKPPLWSIHLLRLTSSSSVQSVEVTKPPDCPSRSFLSFTLTLTLLISESHFCSTHRRKVLEGSLHSYDHICDRFTTPKTAYKAVENHCDSPDP